MVAPMTKLNLPQVVSVLANIAVFGGLIFLGYETRQSTVQLRAAASYSITEGLHNLNSGIYASREFADLIARGEQDQGLQQFILSVEDVWVGAPELYDRLRLVSP